MGKGFMKHDTLDHYNRVEGIPAMTSTQVHDYLRQLGRSWTGQGTAMELGCWLGASSVALLQGLVKAKYDKTYWAFDAWKANLDQLPKAKAQGVRLKLGQDLLPLFLNNVKKVYDKVEVCQSTLPSSLFAYDGAPIEFCLFDAPKTNPTFRTCIDFLSPFWIPGVTILGLLDYNFYLRHTGEKRKRFRAPVDFMKKFGQCFKIEKQWDDECVVFFRFMKKFKLN